jgi:antirestriction protein ArdC
MTATTDRSELLTALKEGISQLTTSDEWQRYLESQARFYKYSPNNVLLILAQRHNATQVASFNAWKRMGRWVKKGEKAIWIVAPMTYKVKDDEHQDDDQRTVLRGFKWVSTFDISATDGTELPSVCHLLSGDDPDGLLARLTAVADSIGFHVEDAELDGGVNGDCTHDLHRIRVGATNSPAQGVKTLAHELAHAILHSELYDRSLGELEAESTAFIVCRALQLDTSDYSFDYVATWAGGGDKAIAGITASCQRIQKAASTILRSFEDDATEEAA